MPDPFRTTLSATETPALWGLSPYVTRWMLYQRFANAVDLDQPETARMAWGKKLQPLVIAQAADDLGLAAEANPAGRYHRRGRLGCSRDAVLLCPERGPGALETKCVFDYTTWTREWGGGRSVPPMHEIQLQQQMLVGDENGSYQWGIIAAWVAGDLVYFERKPNEELWTQLTREAEDFFVTVAAQSPPDPSGMPVEIPWLTRLLPTVQRKRLDLSADPRAAAIAGKASDYHHLAVQESSARRTRERLRAELLAFAGDHEEVALPGGVSFKVSTRRTAEQARKASVSKTMTVVIPDQPRL